MGSVSDYHHYGKDREVYIFGILQVEQMDKNALSARNFLEDIQLLLDN